MATDLVESIVEFVKSIWATIKKIVNPDKEIKRADVVSFFQDPARAQYLADDAYVCAAVLSSGDDGVEGSMAQIVACVVIKKDGWAPLQEHTMACQGDKLAADLVTQFGGKKLIVFRGKAQVQMRMASSVPVPHATIEL